jgi:hypothetical protein
LAWSIGTTNAACGGEFVPRHLLKEYCQILGWQGN